jgi:hypothetical protein
LSKYFYSTCHRVTTQRFEDPVVRVGEKSYNFNLFC